ncbi:MAG: hypothetical protein R2744_05420 [Bacteroidales bacterium]
MFLFPVTNSYNTDTKTKVDYIVVEPFETGTVTDIQGRVYETVKIGNDWWMSENLAVTKYNDGSCIPKVTDSYDWSIRRDEAYCWYNNDSRLFTAKEGLFITIMRSTRINFVLMDGISQHG